MPNIVPDPAQTVLRINSAMVPVRPLELDPRDFESLLPVQHYHLLFEDEAIGMMVGIWDTTTMQEAFGPYPGDEFITVLDGRFVIVDGDGAAMIGTAGQSASFRNGIPVSWQQEGYLRKLYLTLLDPAAETPQTASAKGGVRVLDPARAAPTAEGANAVAQEILFRNDAGTMTITHCAYPALTRPFAATEAHELCRVLAGEIVLTDAAGRVARFGAGDHFFLPRGVACARTIGHGTTARHVEANSV